MRLISLRIFVAAFLLTGLSACGQETTVVDSGTYEGVIAEVNPGEEEIYVEVENTGTLELYFTEATTLTQNGSEVSFSELNVGDRVRVEVERVGQRLDPISVEIL